VRVGLSNLPDAGFTEATVERMWELIHTARKDPVWIGLVRRLVKECPPKDYFCEAETLAELFHGIRGPLVRYRKDDQRIEQVHHPFITLHFAAGDCDDLVTLYGAGVGTIGHPYRIVTVKADARRPDKWSHTWGEVKLATRGWLGADLTESDSYLGWTPAPERYWAKKIFNEPGV
jgi:hypothetical protein